MPKRGVSGAAVYMTSPHLCLVYLTRSGCVVLTDSPAASHTLGSQRPELKYSRPTNCDKRELQDVGVANSCKWAWLRGVHKNSFCSIINDSKEKIVSVTFDFFVL